MTTNKELSRLEIEHQLILDSAGEGVYGLDSDGRITFSNAAATQILGWKHEDVVGQLAHDVHHHSHADGSSYPRDGCPIYAALIDGEIHRAGDQPLTPEQSAVIVRSIMNDKQAREFDATKECNFA